MSDLKYKVIKTEEQYYEYCKIHKKLVFSENSKDEQDEIELLGLLIKDWDEKHKLSPELDPVELIKAFMDDHDLNQTELGKITDYGKSYISEILNYKKRMPKKMIRKIANHFKIRQEALNKPYRLEGERVEDRERVKSNLSPIFNIKNGNLLNYQDKEGSSEFVIPSQGELKLAKIN